MHCIESYLDLTFVVVSRQCNALLTLLSTFIANYYGFTIESGFHHTNRDQKVTLDTQNI